jgi:hypothetical protein
MDAYRGKDADGIFFTSRRDEAKQRDPHFTPVEIPANKKELLPFLTVLANEGRDSTPVEESPLPPEIPVRELSHTEQRVAFETAFEGFPLALQLHYAALACENAREAIKEKTQ